MTEVNQVSKIVELASALVKTPSQGGIDGLEQVLAVLSDWFTCNSVSYKILIHERKSVGFYIEIDSGTAGPVICLDAPIDTAPVGTVSSWKHDPFGATIEGDKLYGRGIADSKIAVSVFCHIAKKVRDENILKSGKLIILLDGDEHTGNFGGVKALIEQHNIRPDFVVVGYPGNYGIVIGARGFYRFEVDMFGTEMHSGSSRDTQRHNAILKMMFFIEKLQKLQFPQEKDVFFNFGPKITVTEISGGVGFSQVPGKCTAKFDVRLTPSFDCSKAKHLIKNELDSTNRKFPAALKSQLREKESWPAYRLDSSSRFLQILKANAESSFHKKLPLVVCGPSNIGNYLASYGINAVCGFGVTYENQHAANECIDIRSIEKVFNTYLNSVIGWSRML